MFIVTYLINDVEHTFATSEEKDATEFFTKLLDTPNVTHISMVNDYTGELMWFWVKGNYKVVNRFLVC